MRFWLSGPRLFNGLVRPGISLGKEDFRPARKAPAMVAEATLGLFRRPDGAILMAIAHMNGDADTMPNMTSVAAFAFASVPASVEVREGARVRLAKHIGPDGLVAGLSVGQVVAAIKAEMAALDVEGKFVRIEIEAAPEPGSSTPLSNSTGLGCAKLPQRQSEHSSAGEKPVGLWPPPELASAAVTGAAAKLGQSLTSKPNEKPSVYISFSMAVALTIGITSSQNRLV
jgi:hypothetical protein